MQSLTRKHDAGRFERTVNYYHALREKLERYGITEIAQMRANRSFLMKTRIALRLITASDMPFAQKLEEMKKILSHELFVKVIGEYPIDTYPLMMRILSGLMRRKSAIGVYSVIRLRDSVK